MIVIGAIAAAAISGLLTFVPPISTGLEARAQEVQAQQQVDANTEFFNYYMKKAEELLIQLKQNADNKKGYSDTIFYDTLLALYGPFLDEIFQRHRINVESSKVLKSTNLIIYPLKGADGQFIRLFIQCQNVPGPDGMIINEISFYNGYALVHAMKQTEGQTIGRNNYSPLIIKRYDLQPLKQ